MATDLNTRLILGQSRKRQRLNHAPKLLPNQQVEVRSVEEQLRGSWHSATVIERRNQIRVVKYHHLLCDDNSKKLVEFIPVLFSVDGIIPTNWQPSNFPNYRGRIRPVPPFHNEQHYHFRQCVDAFLEDAWWEGVIFDHNDNVLDERLVFFPDLGDESRVSLKNLRVTRDWDATTDKWRVRGDWVFLEIIEEFKVEFKLPVFVSVKQIWFELRMTKCFLDEMRVWTCPVKESWKETIKEVIINKFTLLMNGLLQGLTFSDTISAIKSDYETNYGVLQKEEKVDIKVETYRTNCAKRLSKSARKEVSPNNRSNRTLQRAITWFSEDLDSNPDANSAIVSNYDSNDGALRKEKEVVKKVETLRTNCAKRSSKRARKEASPKYRTLQRALTWFSEDLDSNPDANSAIVSDYDTNDGVLRKEKEVVEKVETLRTNCAKSTSKRDRKEVSPKYRTLQRGITWFSEDLDSNPDANSAIVSDYDTNDAVLRKEKKVVKKVETLRTNCVKSTSKRARKEVSSKYRTPRTVLSWLIDNGVILPRAKVQYCCKENRSVTKVGRVTRNGIKCNCCNRVFSLVKFQKHTGSNDNGLPSANIVLEDGRSLLDCQLKIKRDQSSRLKKRRDDIGKDSDFICSVCQYGGELVLCDQCPSAFHISCVGLKEVPAGEWFCPSCCCGICNQSTISEYYQENAETNILNCEQCEKRYHFGCLNRSKDFNKMKDLEANWFCSSRCEEIFTGLQRLLGKSIPVGKDNLTWTLRKNKTLQLSNLDTLDMEESIENYSKLNVAISVMHECFEPVKEPRTGGDVVEDVIFCRQSELRRLNFNGFYTVLLEKDDELISTAVVRVYGVKVAEVPLVGTRFQYRMRGMCHILIQELEKNLKELGVERLVLPAVSSVLQTWTRSFGFSAMTESEKFKFLGFTFLDFQGTTMCYKLLINPCISNGNSCRNIVDLDRVNDVVEESQASREGVDGVEPDFLKCYRRRKFASLDVEAAYQKWMC